MNHTIFYLSTLFLLFFSPKLHAQVIYGTVYDGNSTVPLEGAAVLVQHSTIGTFSDTLGKFELKVPEGEYKITVSFVGFERFVSESIQIKKGERKALTVKMISSQELAFEDFELEGEEEGFFDGVIEEKSEAEAVIQVAPKVQMLEGKVAGVNRKPSKVRIRNKKERVNHYMARPATIASPSPDPIYAVPFEREGYDHITENNFKEVNNDPLSTFSIDVDRASYANVRRFINNNQLPPPDAVRIEEMINYFNYEYAQPKGKHPFEIHTEVAKCPWKSENWLLQIGLQGRDLELEEAPASNLVFLLDVSGSMNSPDKLPLLKQAFKLLVDNLRPQDRVAIAVYAGAAGLVLPSTPGSQKQKIFKAIDKLNAGGSTAGGAGIQLAYQTALDNFLENGNNRVIIATDGDFNVGVSSDGALVRLIEEKRKVGVFLTVLGFGTRNYQDAKMEKLADKGNGNYAYIDNLLEAKKVLVNEMSGTLFTIAKDVKIQIEFNPQHIKGYRLIGYENRLLNKEDFNDDTKDAGELGAGHTVTALYELIPTDVSDPNLASVDPLKYQTLNTTNASQSNELLTVKFRYKPPKEDESKLIIHTLEKSKINDMQSASNHLQFSSAVAAFGMLLRDSSFKGEASFESVLNRAKASKGEDLEGYRAEFIRLVEMVDLLK